MACAAIVQVGLARQSFWAMHLRGDQRGRLRGRTRMIPRRSELQMTIGAPGVRDGRLLVRDRGVLLDVSLKEEAGFQTICPHGEGRVWTRKQAGIQAQGTLSLDGGPDARDKRARGDRRHLRSSRARDGVALVGRRRHRRGRAGARVEPRQRRQRPAARVRAGGLDRRGALGGPAGELLGRPRTRRVRGRLAPASSGRRRSAAGARTF